MTSRNEPVVRTAHVGARRLQGLLDSVLTISSDLDLRAMLLRIIEAATTLSDARYGALGVLDEHGERLAEFITVGIDDEAHEAIGALPKGFGILGTIIDAAEPLRLADLREHPESTGFPPHHPPMQSFLGVPIRVRGDVFGNLYLADKRSSEVFTDIDEELVQGLAAAAGVAIDNARLYEQKQRREATLAAMAEVASSLLAGKGRNESLRVVARHARLLAKCDLAVMALPGPHRGDGDLVAEIADGEAADRVEGQVFPRGESMSGQVLLTGTSTVSDDVSSDPRVHPIVSQLGTLGPALFVPLLSGDEVFGALMVARSEGSPPLSPAEVAIVESFANQASVVLDHERGRRQLERVALLEDQERIGRDLHDTVVQRLFATGLALQGTSRLITDAAARRRVDDAIDELDVVIRHIRTVIFDVEHERPVADSETSVRRAVLALVREITRVLGFEPTVSIGGPVDSIVDDALAADLLATLREALSNVVHHARATRIAVDLDVDMDGERRLCLRVTDDGIGIKGAETGGHGLRNMRDRAERWGGAMNAAPARGGGTTLEWLVPLR